MIDYKKSGVDIEAGDALVDWLHESANPTDDSPPNQIQSLNQSLKKQNISDLQKRVVSGIGGFAALFNARFEDIKKPLLVSCTDGVGTKVKLASYFNDYSKVGYDLVAMCANDLICTGGRPLFFLDYYATGKLELPNAKAFLTSVRAACAEAEMVLIGGETAEMPGVYQSNDFDCAGFSIGIVDQDHVWGPARVTEGARVIGLSSSGYHSNGYSLIRKIFEGRFEQHKDWLMEPTRLYVKPLLALSQKYEIQAAAHITGGGIENLPRVLPPEMKAVIRSWEMPACFQEVQKKSGLSDIEMRTTLNCGIGMMLIVKPEDEAGILTDLSAAGFPAQSLGSIETKKDKNEAAFEFVD